MDNQINQQLNATLRNVRKLLLKYPNLRQLETRKAAIWKYWQEFDGAGEAIDFGRFNKLTNPETISRAIRYWLKKTPQLISREEERERQIGAEQYSRQFQKLKRSPPSIADMTEEEIMKIVTK